MLFQLIQSKYYILCIKDTFICDRNGDKQKYEVHVKKWKNM